MDASIAAEAVSMLSISMAACRCVWLELMIENIQGCVGVGKMDKWDCQAEFSVTFEQFCRIKACLEVIVGRRKFFYLRSSSWRQQMAQWKHANITSLKMNVSFSEISPVFNVFIKSTWHNEIMLSKSVGQGQFSSTSTFVQHVKRKKKKKWTSNQNKFEMWVLKIQPFVK